MSEETTRREFLRALLRYSAAAVLAGGAVALLTRRRDSGCTRDGLCHGCPSLAECGLPPALSRKKVANRERVISH